MASNSSAPVSQGQGLAPSLPRAGHVSQLKNNWRVFEDEAMALQMQHEEINHHYAGNRNRNQQIRADLPQAKQIQNQEAEAAHQEMEKYRLEMSSQAIADERVALEFALRQRGFLDDNEYTRRKDEMLAKSIEDIEKKYRKRNVEDFNPSTSYNDEEYRVQIAKPAMITDEPLYANYQEEKFMNDVSLHSDHRPASRSSQGQGVQRGQYNDSSQMSPRNHIQDRPLLPEKNSYTSHHQQVSPRPIDNMEHIPGSSSREPLSRRMAGSNMDREPSGASGNIMVPPLQLSSHEGRISGPSSSRGPPAYPGGHSSAISSRPVPSVPMPGGGGQVSSNPMPRGGSGSRPHSSLDANRVPPLNEDLNTSSDYLTSRTSSRTSHRSDSSLTSHSEQGAVGYAQGYGPVYGACGVTLPGTSQQQAAQAALDRHKYNSHSSNDFDPMDSITPRRGVMDTRGSSRWGAEASSSPPSRRRGGGMDVGEEVEVSGQLTGAVSLPVDEIGLRSALTPEEIRAAEAAEQLIEQERRDAELALRLQEELEMSDEGGRAVEMDMKFAQEAQDREFARVLQAKEKARLRRAKEKARQKKIERQRLQQQQEETADPDSIQYAPEVNEESLTPRDHITNDSQTRTQSRHSQLAGSPEDRVESRQQDRTESRQQQDRTESRHDRTNSRISQVSPRGAGTGGSTSTSPGTGTGLYSGGAPGVSSLSLLPEPDPPARKPYMHTQAIDSHINDTYCKTQITPTVSNSSSSVASSETSEPQYENLDKQGQPLKTEPILHLPSLKNSDKISPRQSAMNEDMPVPPYMPMQSSATRKSESMERKIKKKKEKEGCKQQ